MRTASTLLIPALLIHRPPPRACMLSCFTRLQLFATPWTIAHQAPLSMGFSRQEYWSGLLCPPPGDLLDPEIKPESPASLALQADFLLLRHQGNPNPHLILGEKQKEQCILKVGGTVRSEEEYASQPSASLSPLGAPLLCSWPHVRGQDHWGTGRGACHE